MRFRSKEESISAAHTGRDVQGKCTESSEGPRQGTCRAGGSECARRGTVGSLGPAPPPHLDNIVHRWEGRMCAEGVRHGTHRAELACQKILKWLKR